MKHQNPDLFIEKTIAWQRIGEKACHAVGQIFAQGNTFNWTEPYRQGQPFENVGSGFLIDVAGHMITSWHVVEQAESIWVQFPATGRQPLEVVIKSVCPEKDIALLQLTKQSLAALKNALGFIPLLEFGDSDKILRADNVMILGYPLMQYRVKSTTGIVSGKEMIAGQSVIQITAPINPGSSGGPVLDQFGKVIGITASLVPEAQNVGYCVPSQDYLTIADDLVSMPFVKRPMCGVQFVTANDSKALLYGNPMPAGLYISDLFAGGLFDAAGLLAGDMVYAIDDCPINAYGDAKVPWSTEPVSFYELVGRLKVGQKIGVTLYRKGKKIEKKITIEPKDVFVIATRYPGYDAIEYVIVSGLVIMQMTENHLDLFMQERPELGKFWQLQDRLQPALLITCVVPGSYCSQLHILSAGDVVTHINGLMVNTIADVYKAVQKKVDYLTISTNLCLEQVIPQDQIVVEEGSYSLNIPKKIKIKVKKGVKK